MKIGVITRAMVVFAMVGGGLGIAKAADRDAVTKQCVTDNAAEKQTAAAVSSYCGCMAGKMASTETMPVTTWEATHKAEQDACAKSANWNFD